MRTFICICSRKRRQKNFVFVVAALLADTCWIAAQSIGTVVSFDVYRFGQGYLLSLRLGNSDNVAEAVQSFMVTSFPKSILKENHSNALLVRRSSILFKVLRKEIEVAFHQIFKFNTVSP